MTEVEYLAFLNRELSWRRVLALCLGDTTPCCPKNSVLGQFGSDRTQHPHVTRAGRGAGVRAKGESQHYNCIALLPPSLVYMCGVPGPPCGWSGAWVAVGCVWSSKVTCLSSPRLESAIKVLRFLSVFWCRRYIPVIIRECSILAWGFILAEVKCHLGQDIYIKIRRGGYIHKICSLTVKLKESYFRIKKLHRYFQ